MATFENNCGGAASSKDHPQTISEKRPVKMGNEKKKCLKLFVAMTMSKIILLVWTFQMLS